MIMPFVGRRTSGRPNINLGGMIGMAGMGMSGGPTSSPTAIAGDGSQVASNVGEGNAGGGGPTLPPTISAQPYTVNHPVLDYLFNHGQGHLAAQQANMAMSNEQFQSGLQLANQLTLLQKNQDFEKAKLDIIHNNALDEATKKAALDDLNAQHAQLYSVMQAAGVPYSPANATTFDQTVTPSAIAAAKSGHDAVDTSARKSTIENQAQIDADNQTYPTMIDTARRGNYRANVASQGALANQPLANEAQTAELQAQPAMIRAELNRSSFLPVQPGTSLYNVNTRSVGYRSPMQDFQTQMMQNVMSGMGGNFGSNTSNVPSQVTSPVIGPNLTQAGQGVTLQQGGIRLPNGKVLMPDGTIQ